MARRTVGGLLVGVFDAVFRPDRFVAASTVRQSDSWVELLLETQQLLAVYVFNLLLYAVPLTLAGFGREQVPAVPAGLGVDPGLWTFGYGLIQNSLFISVATVLTLLAFHSAVVLTGRSSGFLLSAYSVIYSTSAYLAGIFTVVWYLSTATGLEAARTLVIDLQKTYIYAIIDFVGADVGLPGGRPGELTAAGLSPQGEMVLAVLAILALYFLYSLYLASRINHETGRIDAMLVVGAIVVSPTVYVYGSLVTTTIT